MRTCRRRRRGDRWQEESALNFSTFPLIILRVRFACHGAFVLWCIFALQLEIEIYIEWGNVGGSELEKDPMGGQAHVYAN